MTTSITKQQKSANRNVAWCFKRIVLALAVFTLVAVGVLFIVGAGAKAMLKAKYPPIGKMMKV